MRTDGVGSTWRVWVTERDLREARAAWLMARDAGAPAERVLDLLEELERMTRTAAYQATGGPVSVLRARSGLGVPTPARRTLRPPQLTVAR